MLAPNPLTTVQWPIAGDVPDLQTIVNDQALTMAAKAVLIDAYQAALNTAQTTPSVTATATGTATGTSLQLINVVGTIVIGAAVTGTGVPPSPGTSYPTTPPTTILNQQSGVTGGAGTYTTSQATTCTSAALVFTSTPPGINPAWPVGNNNPNTLMQVLQDQTAALRTQTILLQQYQALLNDSGTAPPSSGP